MCDRSCVVVVALTIFACNPHHPDGADATGCSADGSGSVTGTLLGATVAVKDAIVLRGSSNFIALTDYAGACALANAAKANSSVLSFDFFAAPFAVGTVDVGAALDVQYASFDATCNSSAGESSTGGSVTITNVTPCGIEATYDVTLNNDHVTGSFTAANCSPPQMTGCR